MIPDMPYFLTNEEWYYIDETDPYFRYRLTDKAPVEARKSYEDFKALFEVEGDTPPPLY